MTNYGQTGNTTHKPFRVDIGLPAQLAMYMHAPTQGWAIIIQLDTERIHWLPVQQQVARCK